MRVPSLLLKHLCSSKHRFQAKFDKNELYRRPEFEERIPDTPATHGQAAVPESPSTTREQPRIKVEREDHQPETPITYVPRHLRQEMAAAAAQQAQAQAPARALATPPHRAPAHPHAHALTSGSGSDTTGAPANRGPPSVDVPKRSGLATPIQTPAQALRPPPPQAPPPRAIATSPLARIRSAPERSVSFTEPMPTRADSADAVGQDMDDALQGYGGGGRRNDENEDEDPFPLSTQDDAFLATVDLGEGDLGRPIDFEEGMGGVSMMDAAVFEPGPEYAAPPQPQPQVRDRAGSGTNAVSLSGGVPKTSTRNEVQAQPAARLPLSTSGNGNANADHNASARGGQPRPQSRSGPPNTASTSTSSTRPGPPAQDVKRTHPTMTSMGGFHIPPGMVPLSFFSLS